MKNLIGFTSIELRIGNVITMYVKESPAISSIHLVEPTTLMMIDGSIQSIGMAFRPIPLTEEILLRVGFSSVNYTELNGHTVRFKNGVYELCSQYISREYYIEVKHLHQLQNLYFALTGQELNTSRLI